MYIHMHTYAHTHRYSCFQFLALKHRCLYHKENHFYSFIQEVFYICLSWQFTRASLLEVLPQSPPFTHASSASEVIATHSTEESEVNLARWPSDGHGLDLAKPWIQPCQEELKAFRNYHVPNKEVNVFSAHCALHLFPFSCQSFVLQSDSILLWLQVYWFSEG